ncbi:MAG: hypothetical protein DRP47_00050 [Candidatus Zixiibacteriota bacterium]|nr:MAG: hypothetical protein DRP47_00050 [candidate division Zixibacteria bacterium]
MRLSKRIRLYSIILLGTVAARLFFHALTRFTFDDAFITFRYAANLAAGNGFVFNLGDRVLGTTTPLFTLILAALGAIGVPIPTTALVVSLLASGLTAIFIFRLADSIGFGRFTFVPVTLYVLFPRLLPTDTGGMETALFTLLVTAAFYYQYQRLPMHAVIMAALATLVRPEGLLVLGILLAYIGLRQLRRVFALAVMAVLILLPWVVFASVYFGSPIPNSIGAKLALYSRVWASSTSDNFIFVMGWHNPFGWVMFALAVVGGWRLMRKYQFGRLEFVWMLVTIVALTFSSTLVFRWYIAPIYPIYILFASASVLILADKWRMLADVSRIQQLLIGAVLVILLAVANYPTVRNYRHEWDVLSTIHDGVIRYIHANADENDVVATEDLGYVGYYCERRILDRAGLVSPEAASYNRRGDYMGLIIDSRPEWLVISPSDPTAGFLDSAAFTQLYEYRKTFASPLLDAWEFNIYHRME